MLRQYKKFIKCNIVLREEYWNNFVKIICKVIIIILYSIVNSFEGNITLISITVCINFN